MKGFTDSTKMQSGHNFTRTSVTVPSHTRAMPTRQAPSSDPTITDSPLAVPAPTTSVRGLSPTGYAPRMPRVTLKETGKRGLRTPRTSQLEPSNGDEPALAKGGRVSDPRTPMIKGC